LSPDSSLAGTDIGEGTRDADYEGKDVKGKIVLATGFPGAVMDKAVWSRGASATRIRQGDAQADRGSAGCLRAGGILRLKQ
jgi:hypothetical protein